MGGCKTPAPAEPALSTSDAAYAAAALAEEIARRDLRELGSIHRLLQQVLTTATTSHLPICDGSMLPPFARMVPVRDAAGYWASVVRVARCQHDAARRLRGYDAAMPTAQALLQVLRTAVVSARLDPEQRPGDQPLCRLMDTVVAALRMGNQRVDHINAPVIACQELLLRLNASLQRNLSPSLAAAPHTARLIATLRALASASTQARLPKSMSSSDHRMAEKACMHSVGA